MIMKNRNIYLAILFFLLSFTACEDGLEKYPLDRPSDINYLSSKAEMEMAITSCYNSLWTGLNYNIPDFVVSDCFTDIAWERAEAPLQTIGNGSHDSNNGLAADLWTKYYKAIGRCNFIIEIFPAGKKR
jgi:starch-binding outer membrane protein, SusD/RagB family